MTPEERAATLFVETCVHVPVDMTIVLPRRNGCRACVADAVRAAVAEERETCARHLLAQYRNESWAAEAAAAIRARGAQ